MKGYMYNGKREFTTLIDLLPDPLELSQNKKEVWMVPANCTLIKPPFENLRDNQYLVFNPLKKKWDVIDKVTLVPIYSVDENGFFISADMGDGEGKITVEPPSTLIRPKWDFSTKTWVEGKDIEELRKEKLVAIDEITKAGIAHGFEYNGDKFSLSVEAQICISVIAQEAGLGMTPDTGETFNTLDDSKQVVIPKNKIMEFCKSASDTVKAIKSYANVLKEQVRAFNDVEQLKNWTDPRMSS